MSLQGEWQELNMVAGFERNISFRNDKTFKMDVVNRVAPSIFVSTYTGTYTLVSENIEVKINKEQVVKDNVLVSSATVDKNLYEKGTYKVEDNVLTLKYISYPADAPLFTEIKYRRRLID